MRLRFLSSTVLLVLLAGLVACTPRGGGGGKAAGTVSLSLAGGVLNVETVYDDGKISYIMWGALGSD